MAIDLTSPLAIAAMKAWELEQLKAILCDEVPLEDEGGDVCPDCEA